jgi:hypothetical protein
MVGGNMLLNNPPEYANIPQGGKRMFGNRIKFAFLALAAFALIAYSGCILSPDEEAPTPQPKPTYKPLTDKENLIYNLVQCYKEHNIDRFDELLHADYIWYNQEGSDPQYYERAEDYSHTQRMFWAADNSSKIDSKLWLDRLELNIDQKAATWTQVDDIAGVPCTDCWETQRAYYITAVTSGGTTTYIGDENVRFIAIGVDQNGTKIYKILYAYDIPR